MSRIRSKETKPEQLLRSRLHACGYRFRKNVKNLPGVPDIVLRKYKTIIFVHGCFWHQHQGCDKAVMPKSNMAYWYPKLRKNVDRDTSTVIDLGESGWKVLVVWECEIAKDLENVVTRVINAIAETNHDLV